MLGLQGSTSSVKVYRCVACSATFTGLASLLVHQATHASALEKLPVVPAKEATSISGTALLDKDTLKQTSGAPALSSGSPTSSMYICDCGDEFQDFNQMLEHKSSHDNGTLDKSAARYTGEQGKEIETTLEGSHNLSLSERDLTLSHSPISVSSKGVTIPVHEKTLTGREVHEGIEEEVTIATQPKDQCKTSQNLAEKMPSKLHGKLAIQEHLFQAIEDRSLNDTIDSVSSDTISQKDGSPKNQALMKMLATAYMKRHKLPQKSVPESIIHKTEAIPVEITPTNEDQDATTSFENLRKLLAKPYLETKSPGVSRILDSTKKSIVSLTKTFSPVVVLETRQKLIDASNNGKCGRYQCGRCRRVFEDLDSLTEHHSLHRKERIKCCRHCKQLIIGKLPFPDNHTCPELSSKAKLQCNPFANKVLLDGRIGTFHNSKQLKYLNNNATKVFYCPLCKHSYSRRYNLKMHKCQGAGLSLLRPATTFIQKKQRSNGNINSPSAGVSETPQPSKDIAVGSESTQNKVKVEMIENSEKSEFSDLVWSGTPKSFSPFSSKISVHEDIQGNTQSKTSLQEEEGAAGVCPQEGEGGQWTMPLDDDMDGVNTAEAASSDAELDKPISVGHAAHHTSLPFFIRDGVKRYPCNRCQKTYSRQSTLRRHLRLCGFRPHGFGAVPQKINKVKPIFGSIPQNANRLRHIMGAMPPNAHKVKPMFDCFVCGKSFNRKDNMYVHRKKCQLKRSTGGMYSGPSQQGFSGNGSESQQDTDGNWGIMSLPSVLPRRVTCECGAGFTSPRLLLEHLQKHAQESYTCPTCGETVSSWADYEIHLQTHMHPRHQLYKGLQSQRSQPLLLRFEQQPSKSGCPPQPKQPHSVNPPNLNKKQQRIPCTQCNNTFSSRSSLRKHLSLNRCKGGRVTNQAKTNHCSSCNNDFPNVMSLVFHQKSGNCKPAFKPVRCPVCIRWFSSMDGLQKHLLTHNQTES